MTRIRFLPVVLMALPLLTGCGDASGPLDDNQVDELGAALRDETETAVGAFGLRGVLLPFSERRVPGGPALAPLPLCAAGSPSLGSQDGDPVPDSVVFSFTVPPCSYNNVRDGRVEISGRVEIVDPLPLAAGFDYVATLENLAYRYVSPKLSGNYTVIRNGTRTRAASAQGLTLDVNLQVQRGLAVEVVLVRQNWTATLTPDAGAALELDEALPDAAITIAGTFEWNRRGATVPLTVTTPTPLAYDADCTDTPQRIRAGELRASGTFDGQEGYIQLVWNDCGDEPEMRFVAAGG